MAEKDKKSSDKFVKNLSENPPSLDLQINDWLNGGGKKNGTYNGQYFELGRTPDVYLKHGASQKPLIMLDDCIVKITGGKHNISLDEISKLLQEISDPVLLFRGSQKNSFVALTELKTKEDADVVVAIHIDKYINRLRVNKIASMHGRTNDNGENRIVSYINKQIEEGNLLDASIKKAPKWFTSRGLQLPKLVQTIIGVNHSIAHFNQKVNTSDEKILKVEESKISKEVKMGKKEDLKPTREALVKKVLQLFEGRKLSWEKGWDIGQISAPRSFQTGEKYRGINNALLYLVSLERGYQDNRWITFNQIKNHGWNFKQNEDGSSKGKGAGVPIELFRYYDKLTKKDLDFSEFKKLTLDEQKAYWQENVRIVANTYTVFNGDVVEGMPPLEKREHISEDERVERAEQMLRAWNDKQCPIIHDGGDNAYYSPMKDEIHLPQRTAFESLEAYYGTALHEVGHSTGHASRLNRDLTGSFGTELYAKEELRAEFASMFMKQELELSMSEKHLKNHTAYLQNWSESIKKDPDFLFDAIKDADKIVTCITDNAADFSATAQDKPTADPTRQASPQFLQMIANMPTAPKASVSAAQKIKQKDNVME